MHRHYISTIEALEAVQARFNIEYVLDPISMRWVYDYSSEELLQEAQEYLWQMNKNSPLYCSL